MTEDNATEDYINYLKHENADLKSDFKKVIEIFTSMAAMVGMVNDDGTLNENISIKKIMGEVGSIMTSAMMPFGNKQELEKKFAFLKEIIPIYEKHKNQ